MRSITYGLEGKKQSASAEDATSLTGAGVFLKNLFFLSLPDVVGDKPDFAATLTFGVGRVDSERELRSVAKKAQNALMLNYLLCPS